MNPEERGLRFDCEGESLVGVLSLPPAAPARSAALGVVIAVGGPQYRAGSHRQFVLLARRLALAGYATLRFDARGMGDATGSFPGFEQLGPDLRAAVSALRQALPALGGVVVWGLCDAATAAMMNAPSLPGVVGLVLLNPWARHADTQVRTEVKKYYAQRALDLAFWRKLLSGRVNVARAGLELTGKLWRVARGYAARGAAGEQAAPADFREHMARGALAYGGQQLYILAGQDYVCAEFLDYCGSHPRLPQLWQRPGVQRLELPEADHTFSSAELRRQVEDATLRWLAALKPGPHPP